MSAPTRTYEHPHGTLMDLGTAEAITLSKVLSDDRVIAELEPQFGAELPHDVAHLAAAQRYATIEDALPHAVQAAQDGAEELARHSQALESYGFSEDIDATNPGERMAVYFEPEVSDSEAEAREYTPEESELAFAALRKAASIPGYRREATDILAQRAPSRAERMTRKAALKVGKMVVATQRPLRKHIKTA